MVEIWKDVTGYVGLYQVSNLGRVRNKSGLIMSQKPSKRDGYVRLLLYKAGKYKAEYVHILVAQQFLQKPSFDSAEVNHIDANKSNNVVSNLEWVTKRENHFHAVRLGLKPVNPTIGKYGSDNPCSKPIFQYTTDGVFIREWKSRDEAASYYGCTPNSISRCMNGVRKTCKGFLWKHCKV